MNTLSEELAGISASISAINCHLLEYHLDNASEAGATDEEIRKKVLEGLRTMEAIDLRIIKIIKSKLPDFDLNETILNTGNYSNYWIRIPF